MIGADLAGEQVLSRGEPLEDDRTYRVTGSDLEFSIYGLLVDARPETFETRLPEILPELLESYPLPPHPGVAAPRESGSGDSGPSFFWNSPSRWTGRKPIASLTPIMCVFTSAL